jgi:TetR/AcrR family transcriptional repressor of nem operon
MAAQLAPDDPLSARTLVLSIYALMVGTMQLARAVTDRQLADDLLDQGIRNALTLLDGIPHRWTGRAS